MRGGPVRGIGGGACGSAGFVTEPRGSTCGGWLLGNPVRGSRVEGTPLGGLGLDGDEGVDVDGIEGDKGAGDEGAEVDGSEGDREPGVVVPVCARAAPAASVTMPTISAAVRAWFIDNLLQRPLGAADEVSVRGSTRRPVAGSIRRPLLG